MVRAFRSDGRDVGVPAATRGAAVDLEGREAGELRGILDAFLMWAERPSAVSAQIMARLSPKVAARQLASWPVMAWVFAGIGNLRL
jgi:hypothetical protein